MGCTVLTIEDWIGANQMQGGKSWILSKKPRWQIERSRDSLPDFLRSLNSTDRCLAVGCDGEKQQSALNLFLLFVMLDVLLFFSPPLFFWVNVFRTWERANWEDRWSDLKRASGASGASFQKGKPPPPSRLIRLRGSGTLWKKNPSQKSLPGSPLNYACPVQCTAL